MPSPPAASFFGDPAVRYGLKFGLAGVLAVTVSLALRIPQPTWALFTVFVLMIAQYVGAIGEKSVFRFIGTVAGGVTGYLLTGGLQQTPALFLPLTGAVVAFSTAMFGQSRYPYAFLLCGMTTVVVTSNGMGNPGQSWEFMLWRVEEVAIGIVCTLVVQTVLWPRYARVEFLENLRAGFADLAVCLDEAIQRLRRGEEDAGLRAAGFPARVSGMRGLLEFGARESRYFRERIGTFFDLTVAQARMAAAISSLRRTVPEKSFYRVELGAELDAILEALCGAVRDLADASSTPARRARLRSEIDAAAAALEQKSLEIRKRHGAAGFPPEDALVFAVHVLAFQEIRSQVDRAHRGLDSLPSDPLQPSHEPQAIIPPWPPAFWIRTGLRAGIVVIIALLISDWAHPPGGPMLVLGAWVFTALNATSPGGRGDLRAFDYVIFCALGLAGVSVLLLLAWPALTSYAVMCTLIFAWLFLWGFLSFANRGMTIPMQLGMLVVVGILGLNAQNGVTFEKILGFFFGLLLSLVLAAITQRLLWPSLPQREIRVRLLELAEIASKILAGGPDAIPLWQKTRVALIPGEIATRIRHLEPPVHPASGVKTVNEILSRLVATTWHSVVMGRRLEERFAGDAVLARCRGLIAAGLAAIPGAAAGQTPDLCKELRASSDELAAWALNCRARLIGEGRPPLEVLEVLGLAELHRFAAGDLREVLAGFESLDPDFLSGDRVL